MIHNFESPFVFHTNIQNHSTIQHYILSQIDDAINSNSFTIGPGGAKSSYENQQTILRPEMEQHVVWNPFKQLLLEKSFNPSPKDAELTSMWWNVYSPGNYTRAHNHLQSDFSGIYIVSMNERNKTVFHSYGSSYNLPWNTETYAADKIKEGQVMLFPSFLIHSVEPCQNERVVVSFNITVR